MTVGQQYPSRPVFRGSKAMEHAFLGSHKVIGRLGSFDPATIAAADPEEFAALCATTPAIHRFPGSMSARLQEVARIVVEEYDGDASGSGPRPPTART